MSLRTKPKLTAAGVVIAYFFTVHMAGAAIISQWTFDVSPPPDLPDSAMGPLVNADTGPGTLQGVHASASSDWSTPVGNGSSDSYSVNTWTVNDYTQFSSSTTGLSRIGVFVDHISSGTGPRDFELQYSTDGTTFLDTGASYMVRANASPSWTSGTYLPQDTYKFDLSSIGALNNQANVFFRLVNTSTVSANGGTVASGGTSRVDNVTVLDAIPEPATVALAALAGVALIGALRRRPR